MVNNKTRLGYACAIAAQVSWGLFPIYVDLLRDCSATAIVAHRITWSFVLLFGIYCFAGLFRSSRYVSFSEIRAGLSRPITMLICLVASLLILTNWLGFVWAVVHDHKIDASLGYYICPQVVVLLGVIFLGERLSGMQWVGFALTSAGVLYMVRSSASMPLLSLMVAFSFGIYALLKKRVRLTALSGVTFETGFLFLPAICFMAYHCGYLRIAGLGSSAIGAAATPTIFTADWRLNLLLVGTGAATVAPLALYAVALKHIPLSTVGLLQFIGPTIQFLIGLFVFQEPFDRSRLLGFVIVWAGVAIYLAAIRSKGRIRASSY